MKPTRPITAAEQSAPIETAHLAAPRLPVIEPTEGVPVSKASPSAMTRARISTTLALRGVEYHECMLDATVESACLAYERNASRKTKRRLVGKVVRIAAVSR